MRAMSSALPNVQWIKIVDDSTSFIPWPLIPWPVSADNYFVDATNILPHFTKLRTLVIKGGDMFACPLSGRNPPGLFNFPLLQNLSISCDWNWDLEMLSALPLLEASELQENPQLKGNLSSLRALKDTLTKVTIKWCDEVRGSLMDLADFSRLKELDLYGTAVTGDIRVIRACDFQALESLSLPHTVHGGTSYKFQRVSEVPSFMQAIRFLLHRTPTLFKDVEDTDTDGFLDWGLSHDSPDWYDWEALDAWDEILEVSKPPSPPFDLQLVNAGSRLGWSWFGYGQSGNDFDPYTYSCEINWLDPESKQHENCGSRYDDSCISSLEYVQDGISFYRGYYEPPNELEYRRLYEGWK